MARLASIPTWQPATAVSREVGDLQQLPAAMTNLAMAAVDAEDRLLASWWSMRKQALAIAWSGAAEQRWQQLRSAFETAFASASADPAGAAARAALTAERDAAEELRKQLLAAGAPFGISFFGAATSVPLPTPPAAAAAGDVPLPEGWPDPRFVPPAGIQSLPVRASDPICRSLYPPEFLAEAERAGMRLWFLPGRTVGKAPIYQLWCRSQDQQRAALIDVHPVTFGELPRELLTSVYKSSAYRDLPAETMLFDSSPTIAKLFAAAISERVNRTQDGATPVRFELPPDDHRAWPGAESFGAAPAIVPRDGFQPVVERPLTGLAQNGLGYLYRGLREWTATKVVGAAEIRGRGDDAPQQKDVGFRLALVLVRR
jgi:hypothetical protein